MDLIVKDIAGSNGIAFDAGQKVYDRIRDEVLAGRHVLLDFAGVRVFASPFFNAAIGQFLRDLTTEELMDRVAFANLQPVGEQVLARVVKNSRQFYHDPQARKALDSVLKENGEDS